MRPELKAQIAEWDEAVHALHRIMDKIGVKEEEDEDDDVESIAIVLMYYRWRSIQYEHLLSVVELLAGKEDTRYITEHIENELTEEDSEFDPEWFCKNIMVLSVEDKVQEALKDVVEALKYLPKRKVPK